MTLIAVCISQGCVGRCDARCYLAREPGCGCICRGRNHGAGKQRALDNTRAMAEQWIEHARVAGQDITLAEMAVDPANQPLFDLDCSTMT